MSRFIRCPHCQLTRAQLIAQLDSEIEGVKRMRMARTLARTFIQHYEIFPYGVDLICWLTTSRCRTNTEALVCWIERELEDPEFPPASFDAQPSLILAARLERLLSTVEASCAQ